MELNKRRTDIDFSKHALTVKKNDDVLIHTLGIPGKCLNKIIFINTCGVMSVTGDFGNWIFCREFHPDKKNGVSDHYWLEKLRMASTQVPGEFDSDVAKEEICQLLIENEYSDEEREWLDELSDAADEGEYSFIAKAMDRPASFEAEFIPRGKKVTYFLLAIFDGFDEICRRLREEVKE